MSAYDVDTLTLHIDAEANYFQPTFFSRVHQITGEWEPLPEVTLPTEHRPPYLHSVSLMPCNLMVMDRRTLLFHCRMTTNGELLPAFLPLTFMFDLQNR